MILLIRSVVEQNDVTYGMVTIYCLFCCCKIMELVIVDNCTSHIELRTVE